MNDDKSRPENTQDETREPRPEEETAGAERPEAAGGAESRAGSELEEARERADRNWNEYLRAVAELENLRKRSERDLEQAHKFALERFVRDLLPVKDSLEQGLQAAREEGASAEKLIEGKELTLRMLGKVLADHGVEEIDPRGSRFNPELHEAMTTQPSADHEPDTVLMVLQKGYLLNGRLVRPARVVVAAAPDAGA